MNLSGPSDVEGLFRLDGRVAVVTGGTRGMGERLPKGSAMSGLVWWWQAGNPKPVPRPKRRCVRQESTPQESHVTWARLKTFVRS